MLVVKVTYILLHFSRGIHSFSIFLCLFFLFTFLVISIFYSLYEDYIKWQE